MNNSMTLATGPRPYEDSRNETGALPRAAS